MDQWTIQLYQSDIVGIEEIAPYFAELLEHSLRTIRFTHLCR